MKKIDTLHIAIDPGHDTVKVAYTYVENGVFCYGNIPAAAPYPAWGYYDELRSTWSFGFDAIRFDNEKSYKNLVQIKSLFMMSQNEKNLPYYLNEHHFPNFYFPNRVGEDDCFRTAIDNGHTHIADITPREATLKFFEALFAAYIFPALRKLPGFDSAHTMIVPTVIYPAAASKTVIDDLKALVFEAALAFDKQYRLILDCQNHRVNGLLSTKSTAICAYKSGALETGDVAMIFNLGESDLSVAKVSIDAVGDNSICLAVDGADSHLPPVQVGGNDIDLLVKSLLDSKLSCRLPLGQTEEHHVAESGTYKQQYNLMRTIKKAKEYFSDAFYPAHFSTCGVPFSVVRDLVYDISLTRQDLYYGLTDGDTSVGHRIADYVIREITNDDSRPERTHINKVFFVGGAMETYGLKSYVKSTAMLSTRPDIQWIDLDDTGDSASCLSEKENEIFAAAAGGALYSAGYVTLKTLLRKYYGTWMTRSNDEAKIKYFAPFQYKNGGKTPDGMCPGEIIPPGGARYHTQEFALANKATVRDELYSADSLSLFGEMQIGNAGTPLRLRAENEYGLRVLCRGELINSSARRIICIEGVDIDEDGRAKPFVKTKDPLDAAFVEFKFDGDLTLIG